MSAGLLSFLIFQEFIVLLFSCVILFIRNMNSNNDKIWNNYRKLGPGFFPVMLQCIKRHLKFPLLNAVEKYLLAVLWDRLQRMKEKNVHDL